MGPCLQPTTSRVSGLLLHCDQLLLSWFLPSFYFSGWVVGNSWSNSRHSAVLCPSLLHVRHMTGRSQGSGWSALASSRHHMHIKLTMRLTNPLPVAGSCSSVSAPSLQMQVLLDDVVDPSSLTGLTTQRAWLSGMFW